MISPRFQGRFEALVGEKDDAISTAGRLGIAFAFDRIFGTEKFAIEITQLGIRRRFLAGIESQKIAIDEGDETMGLQGIEDGLDIGARDGVFGPVFERGICGEVAGLFAQRRAVAEKAEVNLLITLVFLASAHVGTLRILGRVGFPRCRSGLHPAFLKAI